ncbi:MAG: hypothetical protein ING19_07080 [Azospirillum sp.]|nr:hypothetical protein [Azospirillum sp.]
MAQVAAAPAQMAQNSAPQTNRPSMPSTDASIPNVLKGLATEGKRLEYLGEIGGLRSYVVISGSPGSEGFVIVHVTPSGDHMVAGIVYDAQRRNMTNPMIERSRLAAELGGRMGANQGSGNPGANAGQMSADVKLAAIRTLPGIVWGTAPNRVDVVIDTRCGFSRAALRHLKQYVDAGRVSINVIPAAALSNPEDGARQGMALLRGGVPALEGWIAGRPIAGTAPSGEHAAKNDASLLEIVNASTSFLAQSGFAAVPGFVWSGRNGARDLLGADSKAIDDMIADSTGGR